MAKILNLRERVHQPFRDALVRTSGMAQIQIADRTKLFAIPGRDEGFTNLPQGAGILPSDQSFVTLALRVGIWARNPIARGAVVPVVGGTAYNANNGDFFYGAVNNEFNAAQSLVTNGNQRASIEDVHRLIWQASEQLLWSYGAGEKNSIKSMPSMYFPAGMGLHGQLRGTELIHWNNGMPDHSGILRLARAILIPPRQNILCEVQSVGLDPLGNAAVFGTTTGTGRNMLSVRDNLSVADLMNKIVFFVMDGLFSRDVQ